MAEQTFKSPGFFEREIDLTQRERQITGVPAGIAGTAEVGPAFVPVTVGSMIDFTRRFGELNSENFAPYAVNEFLKNRTAVTFVRVLGAGANASVSEISVTRTQGTVTNAGFIIEGTQPASTNDNRYKGAVQFIVATHEVPTDYEVAGYPIFTDNRSYGLTSGGDVHLVRGMIFTASGSRMQLLHATSSYPSTPTGVLPPDVAFISSYDNTSTEGTFKLVVSSAMGSTFAADEGNPGIKIYTASLDPSSKFYINKILNTNPDRFSAEQHLLYGNFAVESEIAKVKKSGTNPYVGLVSGSANTSTTSGDTSQTFLNAFGRFDTRYDVAKTTPFISQPYGATEYDLFHFETISDGSIVNSKYKISIRNVKKSTNPNSAFGTFTVEIRDFNDTDVDPKVLESYPQCNLNPSDEDFVGKRVGDYKVFYNFDAEMESERRLVVEGSHPNKSSYVRIVSSDALKNGDIPKDALPFGFRGLPVLKTNDTLTDDNVTVLAGLGAVGNNRLNTVTGSWSGGPNIVARLTGSILPPVPFRFKATRGAVKQSSSPAFIGEPGSVELADSRLYWGVKFERLPLTASVTNAVLKSNASSTPNPLLKAYSKFLGIRKLDLLVTGSGADAFNDNKFTLARVALFNNVDPGQTLQAAIEAKITGSAASHIKEAAYLRDKDPNLGNYTVLDGTSNRLTLASLYAHPTSHVYFNRFVDYNKFTNMTYGGFDGNNILDKDMRLMNDRAASSDTGGKAASGADQRINLSSNYSPGTGKTNNTVAAYRTAGRILTDPMASRVNIVAIPGQRDSFITDYVADLTRDYSQAFYVMDIAEYDSDTSRLFDDSTKTPDVRTTAEQFSARNIDNNYAAAYFPDVRITDDINGKAVGVPASVVVVGALGYNDSVAYPWFAPAGFNRGALESVINTDVRLTTANRDELYENRINPIANFPNGGFVIFGQKTLQQAQTALDRVNVRRMLIEVKRLVSEVANKIVFDQNTPSTRSRFVAQVTPLLAVIQSQQGIDQFKIIMDSSNNSAEDIEANRLNGRIILVPTRAVEFIAIDFIITNAGVSFE